MPYINQAPSACSSCHEEGGLERAVNHQTFSTPKGKPATVVSVSREYDSRGLRKAIIGKPITENITKITRIIRTDIFFEPSMN